jgi:signal transduction histidine kinase
MKLPLLTVEIRAEQHVVLARQRARLIAALLGLDLREQTYLATAVSELARNALQYGGGGRAVFSILDPDLFEIRIQDQGPGITDLSAVLEGRYASKTGMGLGISGSRKLVDQFEIESSPQFGTTVTVGKRLPADLSVTPQLVNTLTAELARTAAEDPHAEVLKQNQELLSTLAELRIRQREVEDLNAALNDANQELVRQRGELQNADRMKTEFLAVLAHELRNPLGALSNALYLVEQQTVPAAATEPHYGVARRQTRQLARLVEDLLDVSRITQGRIELRREPVELGDVLADAVESSRAAVKVRSQRLDFSVPAERICVDADAARLTQVFTNLLTNAIKFTPHEGRIWLTARLQPESAGQVEISVRDSGVGIPDHLLEHVFDLFIQAPQTLARSQGGLGIGLMLVRSLVDMHGGRVRVCSGGAGEGAEFTVTLPVIAASPVCAPSPVASDARSDEQPLRVLVVDDHADAADTLGEILETWGHSVRIARDGLQALRVAREDPPDWVVCDIGLPGLDGYGVAAALRSEPRTARIRLVAMTGYGTPDDLAATRTAGFEAHLTKPVDPYALKRLLTLV